MSNDIKTKAPPQTEARSGAATVVRASTERTSEPTTPREVRIGRQHGVPGVSSGLILAAIGDAFRKLDPRTLWRNPVMFVVEIGAAWSTWLAITSETWFAWLIVISLWLT